MLPIPNPTTNSPSKPHVGTSDNQNSGKPASATHKVTLSRLAPGSRRAKRLPKTRPSSMPTKNMLRDDAAAERPSPVSFSRKSAPQYATHHSTETPRKSTPE